MCYSVLFSACIHLSLNCNIVCNRSLNKICLLLNVRLFLIGMLEKGDSYLGTSYDNSLRLTSNALTTNSSTATTLTSHSYHHKKRRLDHVIGELNSEYNANQVGDISSTTSSSRHQLSDSVHVLGLSQTQNFDSYNGNSSTSSSPKVAHHRHQSDITGNHQNFIRASTIKLLDTYQVSNHSFPYLTPLSRLDIS